MTIAPTAVLIIVSGHVVATPQTRDALQEALASAEVDKLDLLRTADGTVIYESSDSQSNNQVRF